MKVFLVFCLLVLMWYNINNRKFNKTFFTGYVIICLSIIITGIGSFQYVDTLTPNINSKKEIVSTLEVKLTDKDLPQQEKDQARIQLIETKKELDNMNKNKKIIVTSWK